MGLVCRECGAGFCFGVFDGGDWCFGWVCCWVVGCFGGAGVDSGFGGGLAGGWWVS